MAQFRFNSAAWGGAAIATLLVTQASLSPPAVAKPQTDATPVYPTAVARPVPDVWQLASPEETDQILGFILQSPLGVAALNQLAIEGFIDPVCSRTLYTHAEFGSFQSLLRVQCPTLRGVDIARAYDEVRVTLNRFEDVITDFAVERIYEDEAGLPGPVAEAVIEAAAQQAGMDPASLTIVEFEPSTWSDGCLGLGGPAESCIAALTEGWQVAVSDGSQTWGFRTDNDASQVRFDPQPE